MKKIFSVIMIFILVFVALALTSCDILTLFLNRTTITEAEWYENMQLTNYTLYIQEGGYKSKVMVADHLFMIQNDLQTVVYDLEAGYTFTKSSIGWMAVKTSDTLERDYAKLGVNGYFPKLSFEDVIYDEISKAYSVSNSDITGKLYFADGILTYASILYVDPTQNKKIEIKDIGKTTVVVEEYTIVGEGSVQPNKADEDAVTTITVEEWLNIANSKNYTVNAYFNILGTMLSEVEVKATSNSMKTTVSLMGEFDVTYYTIDDSIPYKITRQASGQYLAELYEYKPQTLLDLSELDIKYYDLVYNEKGRYYVAIKEEGTFYFYFDNSNLEEVLIIPKSDDTMKVKEIICVLKDIGTTEIDIPKYKVANSKIDLEFELNSDGTGYIVSGMGAYKGTALMIPATHKGLPVVAIAENAFRHKSITTLVIPDSVVDVAAYAFAYCRSLTSIKFGNSIQNIGNYAFASCEAIESIELPDTVKNVGQGAFLGCSSITTLKLGNSLEGIGDSAFSNCTSLENVDLGCSIKFIGIEAFVNNKKLKSITIPDSVTNIGDKVFKGCNALENVTLGNSISVLGYQVFESCVSISSIVIPKSVMYIGSYLFAHCDSVKIYCEAEERPIGWSSLWNYGAYDYIDGKNVILDVNWGYISE